LAVPGEWWRLDSLTSVGIAEVTRTYHVPQEAANRATAESLVHVGGFAYEGGRQSQERCQPRGRTGRARRSVLLVNSRNSRSCPRRSSSWRDAPPGA